LEGLIVLAVTFGLMWVLFILPRQRQLRAHQRLIATIEPGDEVVTGGGIYGTVTEVDAEMVRLEVSPGVELRIARAAVLRRVDDARVPDGDDVTDRAEDEG
jgi:preprotein translocase subunit YajC